jgi:hypothetical protein
LTSWQIHRSGDRREIPEIDSPRLLCFHSQGADYPTLLRGDQDSRGSQFAGNASLADRRRPTVLPEAPFLVGINRQPKLQQRRHVCLGSKSK